VREQPGRGYVGRSIPRREDQRMLRGRTSFVADVRLPGMLSAAFLRSPHAHARLVSVDVAPALRVPGVVAAFSGRDLADVLPPLPDPQVSFPERWRQGVVHRVNIPQPRILAVDKVRHVGEAVAVVVALDRYAAEDAVEKIAVVFDPQPAVIDPEDALLPDAPLIHQTLGTNLMGEFRIEKGDVDGAFRDAPQVLRSRFTHHRYTAVPMEGRGAVSAYDARTGTLTTWCSTQMVHAVRRATSALLGMPEARVRCIAPDVGGGFGAKGMVYPEDVLVAYLTRTLGRSVQWLEDRREHFVSTIHARDQIHDAEVAFERDGRILAVRDRMIQDAGAWNPLGLVTAYNTAAHLLGPYAVPHYRLEAKVAATNKVANAPYRGAGRPEGVFVMERLVDLIAHHLGRDPAEIRARNMIPPEAMPYAVGIPYRDGSPVVYDSGDFPRALQLALDALGGLDDIRRRQREARRERRYLGLGLACYTEGTGVGPFEGATVRVDSTGAISVASGTCSQGQGHETAFAQVAADLWRVPLDGVVITTGDTAAIPAGLGTIASRSAVVVSAAIHEASRRVQQKAFELAAQALECAPEDLELREGRVGVRGVPGRSLTLAQLARAAHPGWDHRRPQGMEPLLEATSYYEPPTVTWAYAAHAAMVEVHPETGEITIHRYVVAHDAGTVINPRIAEGQIHGGVAQGLGAATLEELVYDEGGQLLTTTLMDYVLPSAVEVPTMEVIHLEHPSPLNPLGVKGLGEGGAIAPPAAIANAVSDALRPFGIECNRLPIRPDRIVDALRSAPSGAPNPPDGGETLSRSSGT